MTIEISLIEEQNNRTGELRTRTKISIEDLEFISELDCKRLKDTFIKTVEILKQKII